MEKSAFRRKWVIIPLQVNGKGLYTIDYRMPANAEFCEGMMLSIVQGISDTDLRQVGELNMEFNARKIDPVHVMLGYITGSVYEKKKLTPLEIHLSKGSHIGGYYRDLSDQTYKVNIYLACQVKQ